MLGRLKGLFSSVGKELGADIIGGGIGHILLSSVFGGKKNDSGEWEVKGIISFLQESFEGESTHDAVRLLRIPHKPNAKKVIRQEVREVYNRIYEASSLAERERIERSLGNFLKACRHEIDGDLGIKKIVEEWNRQEGRKKANGKTTTEIPLLPDTADGDLLFITFWNSFYNEETGDVDEAEMLLYFEMLDRVSWQRQVVGAVSDSWNQVVSSSAWGRAARLIRQYLIILAAFFGITFLFGGATLFLGLEQVKFLGVVYFGISVALLGLLWILAYPLRETLHDIHQLLQEADEENRWKEWIGRLPRIVGGLAFLMLVLFLVPYVNHPEYLPILLFAGIAAAMLSGVPRAVAWTTIAVVTLIVLVSGPAFGGQSSDFAMRFHRAKIGVEEIIGHIKEADTAYDDSLFTRDGVARWCRPTGLQEVEEKDEAWWYWLVYRCDGSNPGTSPAVGTEGRPLTPKEALLWLPWKEEVQRREQTEVPRNTLISDRSPEFAASCSDRREVVYAGRNSTAKVEVCSGWDFVATATDEVEVACLPTGQIIDDVPGSGMKRCPRGTTVMAYRSLVPDTTVPVLLEWERW